MRSHQRNFCPDRAYLGYNAAVEWKLHKEEKLPAEAAGIRESGQGLSVIYNYLGGVRLLQSNPPYEAILILLWDAYDVTLTWDPSSQITFLSHIAHVLSFSLGVLSAQFKVV